MSELSELTGAGRGDVIPGYVLSPLSLMDYAEAEEEFGRWHIALTAAGVQALADEQRDRHVQLAAERVSTGFLAYGTRAFRARVATPAGIRLMLYLSLRIRQPEVTWEKSGEFLRDRGEQVIEAVYELMGYTPKKTARMPTTTRADASGPSDGGRSSPPSRGSGSIPATPRG